MAVTGAHKTVGEAECNMRERQLIDTRVNIYTERAGWE